MNATNQGQPYKCALLFGGPGTGKGTQGKVLGCIPGFYHFSSGDMFRHIDPDTNLGRVFKRYSTRGELVPDSLTIDLFVEHMAKQVKQGKYDPEHDLLVLDGVPRTVDQVQLLSGRVEVLSIIHLACEDQDQIVRRLKRRAVKEGRKDDADEKVILHRWQVYEEETYQVAHEYDDQIINDVDCLKTPAMVLESVLHVLAPIQANHFEPFSG